MLRTWIVFAIILVFLVGCSSTNNADSEELAALREENKRLEERNRQLEAELEELKFGAANLLKEAENSFANQDLDALSESLELLKSKHSSSEELIKAQELYDQLKSELDEQERIRQEEEQRRIEEATKNMRTSKDEVTGYTYYEDKTSPRYVNQNGFKLFIAKKDDRPPALYARFQYAGDSWLFIEKYIIKVDDETFEITPRYSEINRDNNIDGVWEYYTPAVNAKLYEIITKAIDSETTIIRSRGDVRHQDRTLTQTEKEALQRVLDTFKALGGSEDQIK